MKSNDFTIIFISVLMIISGTYSQYNPQTIFYTGLPQTYSTAVSPINGEILVGSKNKIQRYDQNGKFIQQSTKHTGTVIAIFWTMNDIISVGDDGQIIRWNQNWFYFQDSIYAASGVIGSDMLKNYVSLNYGRRIQQYYVSNLTLANTYIYPLNYFYHDFSYSKFDYGKVLYIVTEKNMVKYNQGSDYYSQIATPYQFYSIDTHPFKDAQILTDQAGIIYEYGQTKNYQKYVGYTSMGFPHYSTSGSYVIAAYLIDQIMIWNGNPSAVQQIDGWQCSIIDISQNFGVLSVIDSCGNLGIMKAEQGFSLPIWVVIIIIVIVIIVVSVIIVIICKKRKARQRGQIGEYSNNSNQGFSPNYNNNSYENQNQGWNNNNNGNWGNQQNNTYNQGFNNQNQGYQPPNRNW